MKIVELGLPGQRHAERRARLTPSGVLLLLALCGCGRLGFEAQPDGLSDSADGSDGSSTDGEPMAACGAVADTCGPSLDAACCASTIVTGGTFFRGYDVAADSRYPDMTRPATLSSFRLDTYEVTVGRFRQFVAAGKGTQADPPPQGAGSRALNGMASQGGWEPVWTASLATDTAALEAAIQCNAMYQTWTAVPATNENHPIVCITWFEAAAFCAWDGGFLPTEAESMYAASGGSLQRAYPWSSPPGSTTVDCAHANYGGPSWPSTACTPSGSSPVGSTSPRGDGVWGQADLGGNAWEWVLDWYAAFPDPCTDCATLGTGMYRGIRGGSYTNTLVEMRSANRDLIGPSTRASDIGFRCAKAP